MDLHRTTFFSSSVCNCCIVNVLVQFRRIPFRSAACQKNTHTNTHCDFCDANQTKPNKRKKMSTMHMLDHSGRKQRNIKNGQTSEPGICDQSVMIAGKGEVNCVAEMKRTRKKEVHCASFNCVFFAFQIWAFTFFLARFCALFLILDENCSFTCILTQSMEKDDGLPNERHESNVCINVAKIAISYEVAKLRRHF